VLFRMTTRLDWEGQIRFGKSCPGSSTLDRVIAPRAEDMRSIISITEGKLLGMRICLCCCRDMSGHDELGDDCSRKGGPTITCRRNFNRQTQHRVRSNLQSTTCTCFEIDDHHIASGYADCRTVCIPPYVSLSPVCMSPISRQNCRSLDLPRWWKRVYHSALESP
jgi:hypothetical protein